MPFSKSCHTRSSGGSTHSEKDDATDSRSVLTCRSAFQYPKPMSLTGPEQAPAIPKKGIIARTFSSSKGKPQRKALLRKEQAPKIVGSADRSVKSDASSRMTEIDKHRQNKKKLEKRIADHQKSISTLSSVLQLSQGASRSVSEQGDITVKEAMMLTIATLRKKVDRMEDERGTFVGTVKIYQSKMRDLVTQNKEKDIKIRELKASLDKLLSESTAPETDRPIQAVAYKPPFTVSSTARINLNNTDDASENTASTYSSTNPTEEEDLESVATGPMLLKTTEKSSTTPNESPKEYEVSTGDIRDNLRKKHAVFAQRMKYKMALDTHRQRSMLEPSGQSPTPDRTDDSGRSGTSTSVRSVTFADEHWTGNSVRHGRLVAPPASKPTTPARARSNCTASSEESRGTTCSAATSILKNKSSPSIIREIGKRAFL